MYFLAPQFFWFLFRFSISLFVFPFYSYIAFLTFSTSSFSFLSTFKMVVLESLSRRSTIRSFSGTATVDLFFPLNGPYFPVSLSALSFFCCCLFKTGHLDLIMWYLWISDYSRSLGFAVFVFLWLL